jgi:hypothetical protein
MEIRGERPIPGYYLALLTYYDDFTMQGLKSADGELIHITYTHKYVSNLHHGLMEHTHNLHVTP